MPRPANHRRTVLRRRIVAIVLVCAALGGGIAAAARSTSGAAARPAATPATSGSTAVAVATTTGGDATTPIRTQPVVHHGKPVTIEWVGDTVLGSAYGMPPDGGRQSLAHVVGQLQAADLTWGNLEETMATAGGSKCGAGSPNCFAFEAPPAMAGVLHTSGFDLMNMANNHAFDFGALGRRQTVASLARVHVQSTGAPGQITILKRNGTTVAFLGFAPYPWAARLDRIPAAVALVKKASQMADLVVVAIHAGAEGSGATHVPHGTETFLGENRGNSRAFTHAVIDAGADLVVGSGPHVLRGIEIYHGHLIAYSLGNFAGFHNFGMGGDLSLSGILRVTLQPDGGWTSARLIPVRLEGEGLPQLDPSNASVHLVAQLSREDFGTHAARFSPDGAIER
jgi:poly-gamma-glutamate capsule biosynthesis protein CapA/YwtB (metallophosphatase superfamily)